MQSLTADRKGPHRPDALSRSDPGELSASLVQGGLLLTVATAVAIPAGLAASQVFTLKAGMAFYPYEVPLFATFFLALAGCFTRVPFLRGGRMYGVLFLLAGLTAILALPAPGAGFRDILSTDGRFILEAVLTAILCLVYADETFLRRLVFTVSASAVLFLAAMLVMYFLAQDTLYRIAGINRMSFTNGLYCLILLPVAHYLWSRPGSSLVWRSLPPVALVMIAAFVYLSGARALLLYLAVQYLVLEYHQGLRRNIGRRAVMAVVLAGTAAGLVLQQAGTAYALARFGTLGSPDQLARDFSMLQRTARAAIAMERLLEHPFGLGLGSVLARDYEPLVRKVHDYYFVDIQWLTVAVKFGWLGLGMLVSALAATWRSAGRTYDRDWRVCIRVTLLGIILSFSSSSALSHSSAGIVLAAILASALLPQPGRKPCPK